MVEKIDAKNAIADMYLEILKKKPADKITVRQLTEACGVTRQAFYYHYSDIEGVMEYAINKSVEKIGQECSKITDDYESFQHLLKKLLKLGPIIIRMMDSSFHADVEHYFLKSIRQVLPAVSEVHTPQMQIKNSDRKLILDFSSYGLMGYVVEHCNDSEYNFDQDCRNLYHLMTQYRNVHKA